jgi:hypothetical protein
MLCPEAVLKAASPVLSPAKTLLRHKGFASPTQPQHSLSSSNSSSWPTGDGQAFWAVGQCVSRTA